MSFYNLTNDNIMMYAIKSYSTPSCVMSEFNEDMKRFNYIKRLFRRYTKYGELRERLILNHLIVLYNVFGVEPATRMLFFKIGKDDWPALKTYLLFLSYMPISVKGIKGADLQSSDIPVDMAIAEVLRGIK